MSVSEGGTRWYTDPTDCPSSLLGDHEDETVQEDPEEADQDIDNNPPQYIESRVSEQIGLDEPLS